jgi:hypothetical protein
MPGSFLSRHRTICDTLEEIRTQIARNPRLLEMDKEKISILVDEAKGYAQSMSLKLQEYKRDMKELGNDT